MGHFVQKVFDRIIVDYETIMAILKSNTAIGKMLSYFFGYSNKVILESKKISDIICLSRRNIETYGITYKKSSSKPKKTVDNIRYTIEMKEEGYCLLKDGLKIV